MKRLAGNGVRCLYGFGDFRLDPNRHRLRRDGAIVPLSPKAIETLIVLVQNAGKILDRETLMQAVWADTIVEDANLTVAISQLRKALGQNGGPDEFIQTIPRVGYRFVAELREVEEEPAPSRQTGRYLKRRYDQIRGLLILPLATGRFLNPKRRHQSLLLEAINFPGLIGDHWPSYRSSFSG